MIVNVIKDDIIHLSIDKKDFSYRIPLKKIGNTIDWKIGGKEVKAIVMKSVSTWALQLFTKTVLDDKYIKQFQSLVEEHCPNHTINWEETFKAVIIQNEYNGRTKLNKTAKDPMTEDQIISILREKYNLS